MNTPNCFAIALLAFFSLFIVADTEANLRSVTITVNSSGDEPDGDLSDGTCDTGNAEDGFTGLCTLHAAILHANELGGTNTIEFSLEGPFPTIVTSGLPATTSPIIIDGKTGGAEKVVIAHSGGGRGSGLTIMGGSSVIKDLIVYGFAGSGIVMSGGTDNTMTATWIGLNEEGESIPNGTFALFMESGGHEIGCADDPGCGNVIDDIGIFFSSGITIQNNFIGTAPDGITNLNSKGAISLFGASMNVIQKNIIGGGIGNGITLGAGSNDNVVENNFVGVSLDESTSLPKVGGDGIHVDGSFANMIRFNTISFNGTSDPGACAAIGTCDGIDLRNGSASNVIQMNMIGTDITGTIGMGNEGNGILITGASDNFIGGIFEEGNTISDNKENGIVVEGESETNLITGNRIGVDLPATSALGNGEYGIYIKGSPTNTLGGEEGITPGLCTGVCNLISGNGLGGIFIDEGSTGIIVAGNLIGIDIGGVAPLPNDGHGIWIRRASDNIIGPLNLIAQNTGDGIRITESTSIEGDRNRITQNGIQKNGGIGIDLGGDGVTKNSTVLSDGPNELMPYPVITSTAVLETGSTVISGFFASTAYSSQTIQIEFFDNDEPDESTHGEGERPIDAIEVTVADTGFVAFTHTVEEELMIVSATATDMDGNTSEFSSVLQGIIVTKLTDESDADLDDGQCDVDLGTDGNQCTIRAAFETVNNHEQVPVGETPIPINFNIEGGCSECRIELTDELDQLVQPVLIDGSSQEGAACGFWPPTLLVILDGQNSVDEGIRLSPGSEGSMIKGLVLNRFRTTGLVVNSENTTVECNYIGTNQLGNSGKDPVGATGNADGILITSGSNTIGNAETAAGRNLISGNLKNGITVGKLSEGLEANEIVGNLIGTAADGRTFDPDGILGNEDDLGNGENGISISGPEPPSTIIGRVGGANAGNVISGNGYKALDSNPFNGHGINILTEFNLNDPLLIQNNRIGVAEAANPADTVAAANQKDGVFLLGASNVIIGSALADAAPTGGNMIAFNKGAGVRVSSSTAVLSDNNTIRGNSVFRNGFGIDLGMDQVTLNDDTDIDTGPNTLFNFPSDIELVRNEETDDLLVSYRHVSNDGRNPPEVQFDFYTTPRCDPSGHGQGERYAGGVKFAPETAPKEITLTGINKCHYITATATDHLGNTSEFSACHVLTNECLEVRNLDIEHKYPGSSDFEFTTQTTDGNPNKLIPTIRNNSESDIQATLNIFETTGGRTLLPVEERMTVRTFPANSETSFEFELDTRGFAWLTTNSTGNLVIDVQLLDDEGELIASQETPHKVAPRPVIFVHDSWGKPSDWDPYVGFFREEREDWEFSQPLFDLGTAPSIEGGPFSLTAAHSTTTIETHASQLNTLIESVRTTTKSNYVDLIGHGAGGVIGRYYISNNMPFEDFRPVVTNFVSIGVPHQGSTCADDFFTITTGPAGAVIGWLTAGLSKVPGVSELIEAIGGNLYAKLHENSGQNIRILTPGFADGRLRSEASQQRDVRFWRFAGNAWLVTCSNVTSTGDGSVELFSQRAADLSFEFENDNTLDFWDHRTELTSSRVANQVRLALDSTPDELGNAASKSDVIKEDVYREAAESRTLLGSGFIPVIGTSPTAFEIELPSATHFGVTLMGDRFTSRLLDPSGMQIDSVLTAENTPLYRTHQIASPESGTYVLELSHSAALDTAMIPIIAWAYGTGRSLDVSVGTPGADLSLPITAAFTGATGPITGATVSASLVPADSALASQPAIELNLFDDGANGDGASGDGIYGGTTGAVISGTYILTASASDDIGSVFTSTEVDLEGYSDGTAIDLAVSLIPPATLTAGESATFTLQVKNTGNVNASNIEANAVFEDVYSIASAVPDAGSCLVSGPLVTCTSTSLPTGDSLTVLIETVNFVTEEIQTLTTAEVRAEEPDWNASNDDVELNSTIFVINVSTEEAEAPSSFKLHTNYPNPFNPTTAIRYDVQSTTMVHLNVYNALGQQVASLVNEVQPAGRYEVLFDAQDLASGTYLMRIEMGDYVKSKPMTLLK